MREVFGGKYTREILPAWELPSGKRVRVTPEATPSTPAPDEAVQIVSVEEPEREPVKPQVQSLIYRMPARTLPVEVDPVPEDDEADLDASEEQTAETV